MKIYVSGPMTGLPERNYPAVRAAAEQLEAAGFEVINPVLAEHPSGIPQAWTWYMRRALMLLLDEIGFKETS